MRIFVASDAHGDRFTLRKAAEAQKNAERAIFLGDSGNTADILEEIFGERLTLLAGNCDFSSSLPEIAEMTVMGKRIFACHGHRYLVKHSTALLVAEGMRLDADILLYGHTHTAECSFADGMYLVNPGSVSSRGAAASYAVIDITSAGIVPNIIKVTP